MDRKVIFFIFFLINNCIAFADTRQSLGLKGTVPLSVKVETNIHPDGYIEPVIRTNVSNKNSQIKVRSSRSPASVNENYQVIIEAN